MPGGGKFGQGPLNQNFQGGPKSAFGEIGLTKGNLVGIRGIISTVGGKNDLDTSGSPVEAGVLGIDGGGNGVAGITGDGHGVTGIANSHGGIGIYGEAEEPDSYAGYFKGNAYVDGDFAAKNYQCHENMNVKGTITVDGDVVLMNPGGDLAEEFTVFNSSNIDPGTVLVIGDEGALCPTTRSYDTRVAGVVAGAGNFRPAIVLDRQNGESRMPVSRVGKAYCKVDAKYGAIKAGDLLTTSPTQGHAMRVNKPSRAVGAIIGKALSLQESGRGLIPVLLTLH